jgi:alpha-tubulin suppressor-like RCC1 family protein
MRAQGSLNSLEEVIVRDFRRGFTHMAFPLRSHTASLLLAGITLIASGCEEDVESPTGPEAAPELAVSSTTTPLTFSMVAAGGWHTCGVLPTNYAYCWGQNTDGRLGDGTTQNRSRPTPVARGLRFVQVDAGYYHSCGVTVTNLAFCWGLSNYGQLGNGGIRTRLQPVIVADGQIRFRQVSLGPLHSCGITTEDRAYCWGANFGGQLGDGTTTQRPRPVPVAGGLRFRRIDAAGYTCGLTTDNKAYCWGGGQLRPTAIPGGMTFRQASVGCGVAQDRRGYCWSDYGRPQALAGGLSYNTLSVGLTHACGVTTDNRAYCWGDNFAGALGDGTEADRATPTAVLGGLSFRGVDPGQGAHSCGVTIGGRAYCWGHNAYGQLGRGTTTGPEQCSFSLPCSRRPRAVVGPG